MRSLRTVGALKSSDEMATIHVTLEAAESKAMPTRALVAFVQERATKRILAVGSARLQE
jgi:hypothetical protein